MVQAGYAGKLPAYGDFVEGGGAMRARQDWSAWAERGLASARNATGAGFPDIFLTSPLWRFAVAGDVFGANPCAGVLCPSMDKVGRLFPFAVILDLPAGLSPMAACTALGPWFERVETAVLAALDPAATLERLSESIIDPKPLHANGASKPIALSSRIGPLSVTPQGEPQADIGDPLDLSDSGPEEGDGVWITLGGVDDMAHGVMQYGAASDVLFARLVTGGDA